MSTKLSCGAMISRPWIAVILLSIACAASAIAADANLSGIANYRERMALPADVVFEATLEDVSRADAPAVVLGKARIAAPQRLPLKFSITYDASRIAASRRYTVRARIIRGDQLLYITDSAVAVDFSQQSPIELLLLESSTQANQTAAIVKQSGSPANAPLENTIWRLTALGEKPIFASEQKLEPFVRLQPEDKRLVGFGGCNQLSGAYTLTGEKLSISQLAGTMMACQRGMEIEGAFQAMLARVTRWRTVGQQLELLDAGGIVLARFDQRVVN